jgi:hypothetical protein
VSWIYSLRLKKIDKLGCNVTTKLESIVLAIQPVVITLRFSEAERIIEEESATCIPFIKCYTVLACGNINFDGWVVKQTVNTMHSLGRLNVYYYYTSIIHLP